jgi:hypothetical protein
MTAAVLLQDAVRDNPAMFRTSLKTIYRKGGEKLWVLLLYQSQIRFQELRQNTGSGQEVLSTVLNRAPSQQEYLANILSNRSPTVGYGLRTELGTLLADEEGIDT